MYPVKEYYKIELAISCNVDWDSTVIASINVCTVAQTTRKSVGNLLHDILAKCICNRHMGLPQYYYAVETLWMCLHDLGGKIWRISLKLFAHLPLRTRTFPITGTHKKGNKQYLTKENTSLYSYFCAKKECRELETNHSFFMVVPQTRKATPKETLKLFFKFSGDCRDFLHIVV